MNSAWTLLPIIALVDLLYAESTTRHSGDERTIVVPVDRLVADILGGLAIWRISQHSPVYRHSLAISEENANSVNKERYAAWYIGVSSRPRVVPVAVTNKWLKVDKHRKQYLTARKKSVTDYCGRVERVMLSTTDENCGH